MSTSEEQLLPFEHEYEVDSQPNVISPAFFTIPIDDLPTEILLHILMMTLPRHNDLSALYYPTLSPFERGNGGRLILRPPWSLAQVSRSWRSMSVAYPPLWSTIALATRARQAELPLLMLQLERSSQVPLDLLIWGRYPLYEAVVEFWNHLLAHCTRWRSIRVHHVGGGLRVRDPQTFPLLTEIWMAQSNDTLLLAGALNLQKLVRGTGRGDDPPPAQLAMYHGIYRFHTNVSDHLRRVAATIVDCEIRVQYLLPGPYPDGQSLIHLPKLRRLIASNSVPLHLLIAPALQCLRITHPATQLIAHFLQASQCTLTHLTLILCSSAAEDIIALLKLLPQLAFLALDQLGESPRSERITTIPLIALFSALTLRPDTDSVCPKLHTLYWGDRRDAMDHTAFIVLTDMLRSRCRSARRARWPWLSYVKIYLTAMESTTDDRWRQWMGWINEELEGEIEATVIRLRDNVDIEDLEEWRLC
ncbi:hypothetical protein C8F01DRAFT_1376569 [Mycena amicta]|nr:hypothetical protein C8F01DRAFT_1376569 [Mycena amicta]